MSRSRGSRMASPSSILPPAMGVPTIRLRDWQAEMFAAFLERPMLDSFVNVVYRRGGKDEMALQMILLSIASEPEPGNYVYFFKEIKHAKRVLLDTLDMSTGMSKVNSVLGPIVQRIDRVNSTVYIRPQAGQREGPTITLAGADDPDKVRGMGAYGVVVSEAAYIPALSQLMPVIQPMLLEAKRLHPRCRPFRYIQSTPNGRNDFYDYYCRAKENETGRYYLAEVPALGYLSDMELEAELRQYIDNNGETLGRQLFEQEYMCSFDAGAEGQVYAQELVKAARGECRYDADLPLYAGFDLGTSDATAYWVFQTQGGRLKFLECHQDTGKHLEHYLDRVSATYNRKPMVVLPHDAVRSYSDSPVSAKDVASRQGYQVVVLAKSRLADGIDAVRKNLPLVDIDQAACRRGIEALENYRYELIESRGVLSDTPIHDRHSHLADALRYSVLGWKYHLAKQDSETLRVLKKLAKGRKTSW